MNMNDMRKLLSEFLENSTPEQLGAELEKGYRPFFQTLEDPVLSVEAGFSIPASVSFFQGEFTELVSTATTIVTITPTSSCSVDSLNSGEAANQTLALAA